MLLRLTSVLLVFLLTAQAKESARLTTTWAALPSVAEGRKLAVVRKQGSTRIGRFVSADANSLTIDRGRRGAITIPRSEIDSIQASRKEERHLGRIIGVGIGGGISGFFLWVVSAQLNNEGGELRPLAYPILGGLITGMVAAGYYLGRAFDRSSVRIDITDLAAKPAP